MSLTPDILLDRVQLKSRLRKWQVVSALLAVFALLSLTIYATPGNNKEVTVGEVGEDYIARIKVEGVIMDDTYREKVLKKLIDDKHAKAVIISIDSPGGTTAGGEELYEQVRDIGNSGKPVVVVQRTLAASGGYMVSLAGDHIIARNGTITGSIGVLLQSAEFTGLASKIGVTFNTIKSSELKASPSPFEKMTPKSEAAIQSLIDDFYNYFVKLVAERRHLDLATATKLADGRVYTGTQAVKNGLIDEIGGEKEAMAWLVKNKKISTKLEIEDVKTSEPEKGLKDVLFGDSKESKILDELTTGGLLAIWRP